MGITPHPITPYLQLNTGGLDLVIFRKLDFLRLFFIIEKLNVSYELTSHNCLETFNFNWKAANKYSFINTFGISVVQDHCKYF